MSTNQDTTTHFGYQKVPIEDKQSHVGAVFDSVAQQYDIMNDVMSLGIHRIWKYLTAYLTHIREGDLVLDMAAGSGDMARLLVNKVGDRGHVVLADINANMLNVGRQRLIDANILSNVSYVQANAEQLPLPNNTFDCITMAFGLRNVTHKDKALASLCAALKPGGQLCILEFSKPSFPLLSTIYDAYSFSVLPFLGKIITQDADSYRYLAESIRMHPDQATLKQLALDAGFDQCDYMNMCGGIVALHRCSKY